MSIKKIYIDNVFVLDTNSAHMPAINTMAHIKGIDCRLIDIKGNSYFFKTEQINFK